MAQETVADIIAVPAQRKGRDEVEAITTALASLHVRGTKIDWQAYFAGTGARRTRPADLCLPDQRYWPKGGGGFDDPRAAGLGAAHHPLLTATVSLADQDGALLTGRLSSHTHPWLADHAVRGAVLLPGTAFLELAHPRRRRGRLRPRRGTHSHRTVGRAGTRRRPGAARGSATPDANGRRTVKIYSRAEGSDDEPWTQHAIGILAAPAHADPLRHLGVAARRRRAADRPRPGCYDRLRRRWASTTGRCSKD